MRLPKCKRNRIRNWRKYGFRLKVPFECFCHFDVTCFVLVFFTWYRRSPRKVHNFGQNKLIKGTLLITILLKKHKFAMSWSDIHLFLFCIFPQNTLYLWIVVCHAMDHDRRSAKVLLLQQGRSGLLLGIKIYPSVDAPTSSGPLRDVYSTKNQQPKNTRLYMHPIAW